MNVPTIIFGLEFVAGAVAFAREARIALRDDEPLMAGLAVALALLLLVAAAGIFGGAAVF